MSLSLYSFVGTGDYKTTRYQWNGRSAAETRHIAEALSELFGPDQLVLFATPEAEAKHGRELSSRCPEAEWVEVPAVADRGELWELFDVMVEQVGDGEEIVLDITHGFRSQPVIALAVAAYLRATKDVSVRQIVYGAFNQEKGEAEIIEITPFLDLIDWSYATRLFVDYGDARMLRERLEHAREQGRQAGQFAFHLPQAASPLSQLTQALAVGMPQDALKLAQPAHSMLEMGRSEMDRVADTRPLKGLFDQIIDRVQPLAEAEGDLFTPAGFRAQAAMIRFYRETDRYMKALFLAREALVSLRAVQTGRDPLQKTVREDISGIFDKEVRTSSGDRTTALVAKIRDDRNQMAHMGMKRRNKSAHDFARSLDEKLEEIERYLETVDLDE